MTSTLRIEKIEKSDGSPVELTGQAAAKAWGSFNATTPEMRDSLNMASIIDNHSGNFTQNFTTQFINANYACVVSSNEYQTDGFPSGGITAALSRSNANFDLRIYNLQNSRNEDAYWADWSVQGNLA